MDKKSILALYRFQLQYLENLIENIPDERLYELQDEKFNSAGWILGHLCVEVEDVFEYYAISYSKNKSWRNMFRNTMGQIKSGDTLPSKQDLWRELNKRYAIFADFYMNLSETERKKDHPSNLLKDILPDTDSWLNHHITTHIAIHCGNLVVWKKMIGLNVNGF
jgi:hypothetical protein